MLRAALRRFGPPARPTPSRPLARLLARPAVELLESRDTPSGGGSGGYPGYPPPTSPPYPPPYPPPYYGSPTMIRAPYAPYATPSTVGHVQLDSYAGSRMVTFATESDAAGNSVTATVQFIINGGFPADIPGDGLQFRMMNKQGVVTVATHVEAFDFDNSDGVVSWIGPYVDVGVAPGGSFAVAYVKYAWHYPDPVNRPDYVDEGSETVYRRQFDASGAAVGGPVQIDRVTNDPNDNSSRVVNSLAEPKVGADFTVAWRATMIRTPDPYNSADQNRWTRSWLNAGGTTVASFYATYDGSTSAGDFLDHLDIDSGAAGSVVTWSRTLATRWTYFSPGLEGIYAKRVGGSTIAVSQQAASGEVFAMPRVAVDDLGGFAVAWSYTPPPYPYNGPLSGATSGVYARRFTAAGPTGDEFLVAAVKQNYEQSMPEVGMDTAGNFVVDWIERPQSTFDYKVRAQAYTATAAPRGDTFTMVNGFDAASSHLYPLSAPVSLDANGDATASWGQYPSIPGVGVDIMAQRFVRADFDVQRGQTQRSTVQYIDITFNPDAVDVVGLSASGRLRLTRYALTGNGPGTPVSLVGAASASGSTLTLDFGPGGLSDGYYVLEADLNGDGMFEAAWRFYRKAGDMTGTGMNNYPGLASGVILND